MPRRARSLTEALNKGFDENWLTFCFLETHPKVTWREIGEACGLKHEQMTRRRDNPDIWTRGEMYRLYKACRMTPYDVVRIWFNDLLEGSNESEFYADFFQRASDLFRLKALGETGKLNDELKKDG